MHQLTVNHFFDQTVESKQETFEKLVKISRNNNYNKKLVGLNLSYHQSYYRFIDIDLSRQEKSEYSSKN